MARLINSRLRGIETRTIFGDEFLQLGEVDFFLCTSSTHCYVQLLGTFLRIDFLQLEYVGLTYSIQVILSG